MKIALYIKFNGNCLEAFDYYLKTFRATEIELAKYEKGMITDEEFIGKVFHAELKIQDFYLYMCDEPGTFTYESFNITLEYENYEEMNEIFNNMGVEGHVVQNIKAMPYGVDLGILTDKFGITWNFVYCK